MCACVSVCVCVMWEGVPSTVRHCRGQRREHEILNLKFRLIFFKVHIVSFLFSLLVLLTDCPFWHKNCREKF